MDFDHKKNREFLEDLLNKCLALADTIDIFYNAALVQEQQNDESLEEMPELTDEDFEMLLKRLEANFDHCIEVLDWFTNLVEVFSDQADQIDEYEDDETMFTTEEAMRQHKKLYPEDWKDDVF